MSRTLSVSDLEAIEGLINRTLDEKLKPVNTRLDSIEGRLDGLDVRLDRLEGRIDRIENRVNGIDAKLVALSDLSINSFAALGVMEARRTPSTVQANKVSNRR